jgi:hypothetical protein
MLHKLPIVAVMCVLAGQMALAREPVQLPNDPQFTVIELWYLEDEPPREPELAILADGRVRARCATGPVWSEMEPSALKQLIGELLHEHHLSRIDSRELADRIQQEAVRTGLTADIPGAADTFIRIRTATDQYQIRCPAVGILATRFPEVESLQQVLSAQRRLENVRAVAQAGGPEAAAHLARLAQRSVSREHGVSVAVTPEQLAMVRPLPDGGRYCQFLLVESSRKDQAPRIISLFDRPGDVPRVTLLDEGPARF